MKILFTLFFSLIGFGLLNAQTTKVAILDFENTSGKPEYDALGKAISSMLITDLANNIHPKKLEFFERSQLNKLLDEQKLQKSKNFDAKTAVDFGKLSGVNYVFVGSVFVFDGTCNFSSKLVDVQTSKILLAKDVSGKIEAWLPLKSQLAEAIASQLNNPITLDPTYKDQSTSLATLNQYGKIITTMDDGNLDKAEQIRSLFEETNSEFRYFKDIEDNIAKLKERITELENVTALITNPFSLGVKSIEKDDYNSALKYFKQYINSKDTSEYSGNRKLYAYTKMAYCSIKLDSISAALIHVRNALNIFAYYPEALELEIISLKKLGQNKLASRKINFLILSLNNSLEVASFPRCYNCPDGEYQRAFKYGTLTQKTGNSPSELIWYLVYNESEPGLNRYGLKFNKDDYSYFYNGIHQYGYQRYKDNSINLNQILSKFGLAKIKVINSQPRCYLPYSKFDGSRANFSPDSKYMSIFSNDTIILIEVTSGNKILKLSIKNKCNYFRPKISDVFFTIDSKYLVIILTGEVQVWDVLTRKEIRCFNVEGSLRVAGFSPDNKYLVFSAPYDTNKFVRLWDITSAKEFKTLEGHTQQIYSASFSNNSKYLVTTSYDSTVRIWNVLAGKEIHKEKMKSLRISALFDNNDKYLLSKSEGNDTIFVWNTENWEVLGFIDACENNYGNYGKASQAYSAIFSPNNKFIITASTDDIVKMWDILTFNEIKSFEGHSNSVLSVSISPDNKLLATGSCDGTARLWDIATGKVLLILEGNNRYVFSTVFSPDSKYLIISSIFGFRLNTQLLDVLTGKVIYNTP